MLFWIKIAGIFLVRSKRTSIILTLMVISAVSTLMFLSSLAIGVNDAMIKNSTGLFSGHISGYKIPYNIEKKDLKVKGVATVLRRVQIPGVIHFEKKMETITLIAVEPENEIKTSAFWKKTIKGRFIHENRDEIFIGEPLAKRLGIVNGDRISFSQNFESSKKQFILSGIYKTGISRFDTGIFFCNIDKFKKEIHKNRYFWNAGIFLNSSADLDIVLQEYQKKGFEYINFKTWKEIMPDLEQLIALNYFSMSIVIVIVFIIVSLGITSAFSIFILRSIREFGIMKVMGMTTKETIILLYWEIFLVNVAASAAGLILGVFVVLIFQKIGIDLSAYTSHNQYFIVSGVIFPRLTSYSLYLPPIFALLFSFPAAIYPAFMVSRKNAAEILRKN